MVRVRGSQQGMEVCVESNGLPAGTRIGRVRLRVSDLGRSLAFHEEVLGLVAGEPDDGVVPVGPAGGEPVLEIQERRGARPAPQRATGLYHAAIRLPSRRDLAHALARARNARWPLRGLSDHAVSEAIYLADPDGIGFELYADRPEAEWPRPGGELRMTTDPLDVHGLLAQADGDPVPPAAPPGTRVGHVHLRVSDLAAAESFYARVLGFHVTTRAYPGALFLAAGDYHHHVAVNVWAGRGVPGATPDAAGLVWFEVLMPPGAALDDVRARLEAAGIAVNPADEGILVVDPDGIGVRLRAVEIT